MEPTTQEYGIKSAKLLLTTIAGQVYAASTMDKDGDGNISTSEWTGFGVGFATSIFSSFSIVQAAIPEIGDLKGDEFDELTAHVLATDFLPDDKDQAETLVKYVLHVANTNRKFALDLIAWGKGEQITLPSA